MGKRFEGFGQRFKADPAAHAQVIAERYGVKQAIKIAEINLRFDDKHYWEGILTALREKQTANAAVERGYSWD